MSADPFLDTNIIVYCFDKSAPEKRKIAREIVFEREDWTSSWQVVQEFCNVALHRFATPIMPHDLTEFLDLVLCPHCRIFPTPQLYQKAVLTHARTQYGFYDCLIIVSAIAAGSSILYSEDLQDGQRIGDLKIENPFK